MPITTRTEESIFAEALDKRTPEECAAFLDSACGSDADLRARIENLLRSHEHAGSFLRSPLTATVDEPTGQRPGTVIGPYKLLEQIGEGGFGVVFMAEQQQPMRRKVALKVLKPGMDTRQVVAASRPNGKPWLSWSIRTLPVSSMRAPLPPLTQGARLDRTS